MADKYFPCPHCGARVPAKARFCRECGASEESGWGEDDAWVGSESDAGYGPDEDFDYDEFLRREFPEQVPPRPAGGKRVAVAIVVVVLCLAFLVWAFFNCGQ